MKNLFTRLIIPVFVFISIFIYNDLNAQSFSISDINSTGFPKIKASFVALDPTDQSYDDLVPEDFNVIDNGTDVNESLGVECKMREVDPEVSVVLVLDKSTSMNEIIDDEGGETRWNWIEQAVEAFVNKLNFVGETRVAVVTFAERAALACPFTNQPQEILDSLEIAGKVLYGLTNYNSPFLGNYPYEGEGVSAIKEIKKRPSNIRRVFIFLTDGNPSHGWETRVDSILHELNTANVQFYGITLAQPMHNDLKAIANGSGGKAYTVFSKSDLLNIYEYIALDIQRKQFCELIWQAPFGCDEASRYRNVEITFKRQGVTRRTNYLAPLYSIASVETNGNIISFSNPDPGNSVSKKIVFTPKISPLSVEDINIIPDTYFKITDWGGTPPPFVIDSGASRTFTVEFTQQGVKAYRQAAMIVDGLPCPPEITLVGGTSQIMIIQPNGGELFSTCDEITIQWGGVEPEQKVILWYSDDNGASWNLITNNASGLSHKWKPPHPGTQYLIRGAVAAQSLYLWAKNYGGSGSDFGRSLAIADDDLYFYVAGSFEGTTDIGGNQLESDGQRDILLTKFNSDGQVIWTKKAGGLANDSAAGVCVDPSGNAYVTGACMQTAQFGILVPNMEVANAPYCFLAKYPASGAGVSVNINVGPTKIFSGFKAWGEKIRYENNKIYVQGYYTGGITIQNFTLPERNNPTKFTAEYGTDLFLQYLTMGWTAHPDYSDNKDQDTDGNEYETGSFTGSISFSPTSTTQPIDLSSAGGSDIYVSKFGGTPGSEDLSDAVFTVSSPVLSFTQQEVDLGAYTINETKDSLFTGLLCNTGNLSEEITKVTINGTADADYSLITQLEGLVLYPGDCVPVEISFTPQLIGARNAQLTIESKCANPITLILNGEGICSGEPHDLVDFGKMNIGVPKDSILTCALFNTNNTDIVIKPSIDGTHASDFQIMNPQASYLLPAGDCFEVTIRFTPQGANLREAVLNYNLPDGCEELSTILNGFGVMQDIGIEDIDWKQRRLKTVNDTMLRITNDMELDVDLLSVSSANLPQFIVNNPALPQTIPAKGYIDIPLSFTPDEEKEYFDTLYLRFENVSELLPSFLHGEGVLPKIEYYWVCDSPIKPGETSTAVLEIENPSASSDLYVKSISLEAGNTEYEWAGGTAPGDFTIQKNGGSRSFDITFMPQQPGTREVDITIIHDAVEGPDMPFEKTDVITRSCEALGLTYTNPIDFEGVMICDTRERSLRIDNQGGSTYLNITGYTLTGADAYAFDIPDVLNNMQVAPENFREVKIGFTPDEMRSYLCTLNLQNNIGQEIAIELMGEGVYIELSSPRPKITRIPGEDVVVPVHSKIGSVSEGYLSDMTLNVNYYNKMLLFTGIEFKKFNGWQWSAVETGGGNIEISGTGRFDVPYEGEIFTLNYILYLSDEVSTDILAKPLFEDCETEDTLISTVFLGDFCFKQGRLVEVSGQPYSLSAPAPNPASGSFELNYVIALEAYTTVSLYNSLGSKVMDLSAGMAKPGQYSAKVNTDNLTSGVYFIKISSGPWTDTKPVVISK